MVALGFQIYFGYRIANHLDKHRKHTGIRIFLIKTLLMKKIILLFEYSTSCVLRLIAPLSEIKTFTYETIMLIGCYIFIVFFNGERTGS